jgi:hypothetical protein
MPSRVCRNASALVAVMTASASLAAARPVQAPDYAGFYAKGTTFATFLEHARAQRDDWRRLYNDAAVTPGMITRMRALPERRLLLVVADDWCADSVQTIPYLARLVDGAPERLQMRIVDSAAGRSLMEAHRTPDGRTATPTVLVLGEDGRFIAAWVERPSTAQTWFLDQQKVMMQKPLHEALLKWYVDDAGRTTVAEVAELLAR